MANYCSFEIRIKGKRGNAVLLCHSIPTMDGGSITYAKGSDDAYEVRFRGSCKWSVNFNVTDDWDGNEIDTDLNGLPESMLISIGSDLWDYSLRAKSRVLECEVLAHYWSEETAFDHFDHFVNGRRIKKRRIAYDYSNKFDWDSLEFVGHEGECDDSQTSEATSLLYANRYVRHFDPSSVLSVLHDQYGDVTDLDDAVEDDEDNGDFDEDESLQKLKELLDMFKEMKDSLDEDEDDFSEDDSYTDADDEDTTYTELRPDETKRISTSDWSVSLPLGFCETKSSAILAQLSDQKLLVPEQFAYTDSLDDIPVKIAIPNDVGDLEIDDTTSYIDIHSKQGLVRLVAVDFAREASETFGHPHQIVTVNNDNAGLFILFVSSKNTTIATCCLMTLTQCFQIKVIVDIDSSMVDELISSIGRWLATFEFTNSKWEADAILLEEPNCLKETLRGQFAKYDEAVDQLVQQYQRTAYFNIEYLKYIQTVSTEIAVIERNASLLLRSAFETKKLGVDTATAFVEKLIQHGASESVLQHVYAKLADFEPACEAFKIELADDEKNDGIELGNGVKMVMARAVHDTQIVRVNEPLSIKGVIAKWKQKAGIGNPSDRQSGFMSPLEFIRAKQEIEEKRTQLSALFEEHIDTDPVITIPGKKFVFTGLGVIKADQKDQPIVQQVIARGGLFRQSISGVTDYLVVGDDNPGESKIKEAIAQKEAGKPIQIIRLKDLEDALAGRSVPAVSDDYMEDHDREQEADVDPEALASIHENLNRLTQSLSDMQDALGQFGDFQRQQEEEKQRREKELEATRANAVINADNDEACMHVTLSLLEELGVTEKYGSSQEFFDCFGEDFPAYEQDALWKLQCRVKERRRNDGYKTAYERCFMSLDAQKKFSLIVASTVTISPMFDINARFDQAMKMGDRWFEAGDAAVVQSELEKLKKKHRDGLQPQFAAICDDWLKWATAKPLMYVEYLKAPSPYDENTLSKQIGDTVVTLRIRSSRSSFIVSQILNWCAWYWDVSIDEIWAAAYKNRFDSYGNPLEDKYVSDETGDGDISSKRLCKALDAMGIAYQPQSSAANGYIKSSGSSASVNERHPRSESAANHVKGKKEGCYIATAVYGSYDAPEVLVLRRFRDETLKRTMLGRGFIRTYYALSPALAQKLRTAARLNALVRKGLDFFVRFLQNK